MIKKALLVSIGRPGDIELWSEFLVGKGYSPDEIRVLEGKEATSEAIKAAFDTGMLFAYSGPGVSVKEDQ